MKGLELGKLCPFFVASDWKISRSFLSMVHAMMITKKSPVSMEMMLSLHLHEQLLQLPVAYLCHWEEG